MEAGYDRDAGLLDIPCVGVYNRSKIMPNPMPIQFAFQGGGARLAYLLGAAEEIQEQVKAGNIRVTNVAGTSAGAVVAALIAAGQPVSQVVKVLSKSSSKLHHSFPRPHVGHLFKVLLGQPIWNEAVLKEVVAELLGEKANWTIRDICRERQVGLHVVATNLTDCKRAHYGPQDASAGVATLVTESCRLPFLFRSWKSGSGDRMTLDGGLTQNLPADVLEPSNSDGPVVGISFEPKPPVKASGLLSFAGSLLEVAIESSQEGARRRLGVENIIELPGDLQMHEFERAVDGLGKNGGYETSRFRTREAIQRVTAGWSPAVHVIDEHLWQQRADSFMRQLGQAYEAHKYLHRVHYEVCSVTAQACSLGSTVTSGTEVEPDILHYHARFTTGDTPLQCRHISVSSSDLYATQLEEAQIRIEDLSGDLPAPVSFIAIPVHSPTPTRKSLLLYFTPPLPAKSGPYVISFHDRVKGFFSGLLDADRRRDHIQYQAQDRLGAIGEFRVVLSFPSALEGRLRFERWPNSGYLIEMRSDELSKTPSVEKGFSLKGWKAQNVEQASIGIDILLGAR